MLNQKQQVYGLQGMNKNDNKRVLSQNDEALMQMQQSIDSKTNMVQHH